MIEQGTNGATDAQTRMNMKVGDGGFGAGDQGELLQRMQRAHTRETEAAGEVGDAGAFDASQRTSGIGKSDRALRSQNPELEAELLSTASDALEGKFEGDDQIRGAVVETIVDTRYGDDLADSERTRIVSTLEQTLVDDHEFRAEVDNMLILAARQLARS